MADTGGLPPLPDGFQLDSASPAPSAVAPPPGFQLDSAPAAPPAQAPAPGKMPSVAPADVASTLGHNPLAGVYTPPGGQPDTTVAPSQSPQQAPQGVQPQPQPAPQAQGQPPQGAPAAQPGGAAPSPLGQAEQSGHDAKLKQALTPPNITESAIPQTVSPNPPPPQIAPAPSQDQINQQAGVNPNSPTTQPMQPPEL